MDRKISRSVILTKGQILLTGFVFLFLLLTSNISHAEEDRSFLPAEKAFALKVKQEKQSDTSQTILSFDIAPGYLLYQEHLQIKVKGDNGLRLLNIVLPPAHKKQDPILGEYYVYQHRLDIPIPLGNTKPILISYQGCSEGGFCYAPQVKQIILNQGNGNPEITDVDPSQFNQIDEGGDRAQGGDRAPPLQNGNNASESDNVSMLFQNKSVALTLLAFFGLGIMLAFTPCVLPMIPIMANILVGADKPLSSRRAVFLASLYVLSVAVCYAFAGVLAGLLGNHLQVTLQQPPFLIGFSLLLLIFGLSQFNLINIRVPQVLSGTLHNLERRQKQGSAFGAMGMGVISALMASPCVTPALVGALTFISQTGNAVLGGSALFMMSLGMGLPLLLVATVGSRFLPKTGPWMVTIKSITGVLLLVLAVTFLYRAIPNEYLPSFLNSDSEKSDFITIQTPQELAQILNKAKTKPVILDVYAKWCVSCQRMDRAIFENPEHKNLTQEYQLLRLDITTLNKGIEQLLKDFSIIGPPTVIFFDKSGQELKDLRLVGEVAPPDFLQHIQKFDNKLSLSQSQNNEQTASNP